jgi:hypothetical protein
MNFATMIIRVASQRVFVVYLVIDSIRKLLVTPSYWPVTHSNRPHGPVEFIILSCT